MAKLEITPISPVLGAEVRGVDLADGIDDVMFAVLHAAFLDHGVLLFKDQTSMVADVQVAFARRLGPLHEHPAAPAEHDDPAVFLIRTHRDSSISNGNGWHSDVSCAEEPPSVTMLQVHVLPEGGGGDTCSPTWRPPTRVSSRMSGPGSVACPPA
ncbi:MAG: TauD/TfdA family dioxygenase, partial [Acidimicrobiales bacterium]|nr:TauD/TfdA family dioxygenase [Acidimicrobiales bacterium]